MPIAGNESEEQRSRIRQLIAAVQKLKAMVAGKEITAKLHSHLSQFDRQVDAYEIKVEKGEDLDAPIKNLGVFGTVIALAIKESSYDTPELLSMAGEIEPVALELIQSIEQRKVVFGAPVHDTKARVPKAFGTFNHPEVNKNIKNFEVRAKEIEEYLMSLERRAQGLPATQNAIDNLNQELQGLNERLLKHLSEASIQVELAVNSLKERTETQLKEIGKFYDSTKEELQGQKKEVDDLVGTIAGGVIAGDYGKTAEAERKTADYLRYGSLLCMAAIAGMVGYSFYETTIDTFRPENSLFRLVFSVLLSIPAAYLARESAKHRLQQYAHQQTSLDLKAITPYLASLPEGERHRLKAEIASKLFGNRDFNHAPSETYPINAQELLVALINKVGGTPGDEKRGARK